MQPAEQRVKTSVVVCTYNRSQLLRLCLESLTKQRLGKNLYEVIIVDNNSTDDTRAVCEQFCRQYNNIRYCFEQKIGLSYARNRGFAEADGEYIAYLDDDAKVPEQWLSVAVEIIDKQSADVFGGPYFPIYDSPKPVWFKDSYGTAEMAKQACILSSDASLSGGNLFIRRRFLKNLGGFDVSLGMKGSRTAYGEETDLIRRIRNQIPAAVIYYEPRLFIQHFVRANKMTLRWALRRAFISGRYGYAATLCHQRFVNSSWLLLKAILVTLRELGRFCIQRFDRHENRVYPFLKNFLYEVLPHCLWILGVICEQCNMTMRRMTKHKTDN
jgi:glycosyltransferase involved in cell wall biosynthesis